jgi:HD superfamily phosphohydrolase YqeK
MIKGSKFRTYENIYSNHHVQMTFNFYELSKSCDKVDHGLGHAEVVVKNMEQLCKIFKIPARETEALKIAALLHDIGINASGKAGHDERGYEWAKNLFADHPVDMQSDILGAIRNHSGESTKAFDKFLAFADKIDIRGSRLTQAGGLLHGCRQYLHLLRYDFGIHDGTLYVRYFTDGKLNFKELDAHYFIPKLFGAVSNFAKHFGLNHKILLDSKEWLHTSDIRTYSEW